jgi:CHAT domain-containing protein/Tfp pilus assembly protein PilF
MTFALALFLGAVLGADDAARPLEIGPGLEAEIAGKQMQPYLLALETGQLVHVTVSQAGVDVAVRVLDPQGREVGDFDGRRQGLERVYLVAETGGSYRLEVRAAEREAPAGRYRIRLEELRPASAEDTTRVRAQGADAEARRLSALETREGWTGAAEKLEAALPLWRALADRHAEADALERLGRLYERLRQNEAALDRLAQALARWRELGEPRREAATLIRSGVVHWSIAEQAKALEEYQAALVLTRAAGDAESEAMALNNLGLAYWSLGESARALEYYEPVLALWEKRGNRREVARTLNNIGLAYWSLSELQKSLDAFGRSLPLRREAEDRTGEAVTLHNMGILYQTLGDLDQGLDHYEQALAIRQAVGDRRGEAKTLHNIGSIYEERGEKRRGLEYYEKALPLRREVGDRAGLANTLQSIGNVYKDLRQWPEAQAALDEALALSRSIGDRRVEALTLVSLGGVRAGRGELEGAAAALESALRLSRETGDRGGQAEALHQLARVQREAGDLYRAKGLLEEAIVLLEDVRTEVASHELRSTYLATHRDAYELQIDVLMRLHRADILGGYDAEAFAVSERARARGLLDTLVEARADLRRGVEPALLAREEELQRQINVLEQRRTSLLGQPEKAAEVGKELDRRLAEHREVRTEIRLKSPRYAALTEGRSLTVSEVQSGLLDPDTVLLEYSLGAEKSYLWAIGARRMRSYELPPRERLEEAARRLYQRMSAPGRVARAEMGVAGAELSRLLLGPLTEELAAKRVVVVVDGALHYISFAALPWGPQATPLVASHEVVSLPSASTLAVLRGESAGRSAGPATVAVVSDPVFRRDDPRVLRERGGSAPVAEGAPVPDLLRSASESGLTGWERLPFSRQEAEGILALAGPSGTLRALDFDASRETVVSPELGGYRIVHFATHGLINSQHPELSGLVLSLVDRQGRPVDGFFRLHEIYNLKLEADLVVLSACRTALGKQVKGEGLIGLTRGFMHAGAPRVVASLWNVRDQATAELMRRFYRGLLKEGLTPSAALRAAQISLAREPAWQSPYYWAGFVLQGDWR